jgi:hypothetical protein
MSESSSAPRVSINAAGEITAGYTVTPTVTPTTILCHRCGMVSHNTNDVRERYCGACHAFHMRGCACGLPLHYSSPEMRWKIEALFPEASHDFITVADHLGRHYRVQRHYVALHGIRARALESLADQGIITRLVEESP